MKQCSRYRVTDISGVLASIISRVEEVLELAASFFCAFPFSKSSDICNFEM